MSLFPNTRSRAASRLRDLTKKDEITKAAEQFLTDYPDTNIPAELTTEALYLDWKDKNHWLQKLDSENSDPSFDRLLAVAASDSVGLELLVCSVGGETGNELYISALLPPEYPVIGDYGGLTKRVDTHNLSFKPSLLPAYVFESPILQIALAPPRSAKASIGSVYGPWIAIRTAAGTVICSIVPVRDPPGQEYALELIFDAKRDNLGGGSQHSDVCFNPKRRSEALITNRHGEVFLWRADTSIGDWRQKAQSCEMVASALDPSTSAVASSKRDGFWRLAWGIDESIAFLISTSALYRLDILLRDRSKIYDAGFHLSHRARHNFTSIVSFDSTESFFPAIYLSTTFSVFVFDQRNTSHPIFILDHNLNSDFSVSLSKSSSQDTLETSSVVLSSQRERFSVNLHFDTSRGPETAISLASQPSLMQSSLPSGTLPTTPPISIDLRSARGFEIWAAEKVKPLMIFERGSRGEIWAGFFSFEESRIRRNLKDPLILVKRRGLLRELERDADRVEDLGKLGEPELRIENFGAIYRAATNGTLFRQASLLPDALGNLAFQNMRAAAVYDEGLYPDIGVSSNIVTTSIERARPSTKLGLKYFSRVHILGQYLRSSPLLRYVFLGSVKRFKNRTAPSIDLSFHIQSEFFAPLSLRRDAHHDWEDEDEDEEPVVENNGFVKAVERWEISANELADKYLTPASTREHLDHLSSQRYDRVQQAIQDAADQISLDLILASQVWLPKYPLEVGFFANSAVKHQDRLDDDGVSRAIEWRDDHNLQDPPELHFYLLSPNLETISESLLTISAASRKVKYTKKVYNQLMHGTDSVPGRFLSRSLSLQRDLASQSGTAEERSGSDLEIDTENEIKAEELGVKEGEPNTLLGAKSLLAEWQLGTDPNDYVYFEPYEKIERLKTGREPVHRLLSRDRSQGSFAGDRTRSQSAVSNSIRVRSSRTPGVSASQPLPRSGGVGGIRDNRMVTSLGREIRTPNSRLKSHSPASSSSSQIAQDNQPSTSQTQNQSQSEYQSQLQAAMASQFVPGKFATRPPDSSKKKKKKPAKRRKSGF